MTAPYRPVHLVLQILVDPLKSCIAALDPAQMYRSPCVLDMQTCNLHMHLDKPSNILSWWSWWRISFKIPPQILRSLRVKDWLKPSKLVGDVSFDKTQVNLQKQTQGLGSAAVYQHKAVYRFISALSFVLFHHTLHFILSGLQVNGFLGASGVRGGRLAFFVYLLLLFYFRALFSY